MRSQREVVVSKHNQHIMYKYMGHSDTLKNVNNRDWLDCSAAKNTGFSSRGPRFNSQHQHGGLRLSITPWKPGMHMGDIHYSGKAFKHIH